MAGPSYLPEAIPTALGWAHPLTGEQLDVTSGLEDAVDYYKPNAGALSFIDPEGETEFLGFAVVAGRKARLAVHTLHPIVSVTWSWDDESDDDIGGYQSIHVFPESDEEVTYTVTATVTYLIQDPEGDEGDLIEEEEEVEIEVVVPASLPAPPEPEEEEPVNVEAPTITGDPEVGATLTVVPGEWTGVPAPTLTYQWQSGDGDVYADIADETGTTYEIQAGDENDFIRVVETATNTAGTESFSSAGVGPVLVP